MKITLYDVETYLKVFWEAYDMPPSAYKNKRYKKLHVKLYKLATGKKVENKLNKGCRDE